MYEDRTENYDQEIHAHIVRVTGDKVWAISSAINIQCIKNIPDIFSCRENIVGFS